MTLLFRQLEFAHRSSYWRRMLKMTSIVIRSVIGGVHFSFETASFDCCMAREKMVSCGSYRHPRLTGKPLETDGLSRCHHSG